LLIFRLLESLDDKRRKTEDDLKEIVEALDSIVREKTDLNKLKLEVESFYVFDADLVKTEEELRQLRNRVESRSRHAKDLSSTLKDKYNKAQQLVPSDVAQELNQLELLTEAIASAMDEKDREFKKARTIRTDYLNDVEDVQSWIKDAELKVQDRSVEPQLLQEHLQQIQAEIGTITDRLEKLIKNGKVIIEKTKDDEERELIRSTMNDLADQLQQVRSWLEEKRQQVGETLDAWQRFLTLYQTVMAWVQEKRVFLKDPLYITTLTEARQRLHDYSVSIVRELLELLIDWFCREECCEELQSREQESERDGEGTGTHRKRDQRGRPPGQDGGSRRSQNGSRRFDPGTQRPLAGDVRRVGTVREEDEGRPRLDREKHDRAGVAAEQEETVEGPARPVREDALRHPDPKDQDLAVCGETPGETARPVRR
jgi:hypothetical protein